MRPWEYLECTPGEVETIVAAEAAQRDQEWLLTAWQTSRIGPMVWASKAHSPLELLGWNETEREEKSVGKLRLVAFLRGFGDEVKRNRGH